MIDDNADFSCLGKVFNYPSQNQVWSTRKKMDRTESQLESGYITFGNLCQFKYGVSIGTGLPDYIFRLES